MRRLRGLSCGPDLLLHLCSQVVQWNKAGALVSKAVSSGVINTRETRPPYLVNFQLDLTLYGRLDTFDKKNVCFRIVEERLCLPRPPACPSNGVACKAKALGAVQGGDSASLRPCRVAASARFRSNTLLRLAGGPRSVDTSQQSFRISLSSNAVFQLPSSSP